MTTIRQKNLPAAAAPTAADVLSLDGATMRGITIENLRADIRSGVANLGYSTGAGGAITQLTSRVTGVTLNKAAGAITLFAAAPVVGTPITFTVTNSLVAATDVVVVSVKSSNALNFYNVFVTAVAASSFNVTVNSVSGTTSDSPVLNFAVIKAVAA